MNSLAIESYANESVNDTFISTKVQHDIGPFRFLKSNGSQLLLERVNLPWGYIDQRGVPNVYIKDHQGNVRAVYNQLSGGVTQQTDYYPYGLPKAKSTNAEANPFKYVGKELTTDFSNPFYDFEARVQLPTLGLFNRPDPKAIEFPWLNTFSYCGADPVNKVDENGEDWTDVEGNPFDDLSKIKRYIFFTDEFKDQAKIQYQDGVKLYGEGSVAMSNTGSARGFSLDWSNINGQVKDIMIMAHGKNQSINVSNKDVDATNQLTSTGDGMTNGSKTQAINIQDLESPKGNISDATLYLYTCHSADIQESAHKGQFALAGSKQTVSQAFSQSFDFRFVVGTMDSVNYYGITQLFLRGGLNPSNYLRPYPVNGEWIIHPNPKFSK